MNLIQKLYEEKHLTTIENLYIINEETKRDAKNFLGENPANELPEISGTQHNKYLTILQKHRHPLELLLNTSENKLPESYEELEKKLDNTLLACARVNIFKYASNVKFLGTNFLKEYIDSVKPELDRIITAKYKIEELKNEESEKGFIMRNYEKFTAYKQGYLSMKKILEIRKNMLKRKDKDK